MCLRPRPHHGRASFANGQDFREVGLHQCASERRRKGGPVCSEHVPSHVPSHTQTTAKVRGFSPTVPGCTAEIDSLLEESGFEPLVPLTLNPTNAGERDEKKRSSSWQIEARASPRSQWLAQDSPLEERGFEPLVPHTDGVAFPNTFLPPRVAPSEGRSVPARGERPTGRIPLSSTAALLRTW
jgi:hypothetical protein